MSESLTRENAKRKAAEQYFFGYLVLLKLCPLGMNEVVNSDHDHSNVTSLQLKTATEKLFSVCVFFLIFNFLLMDFFGESFNLAPHAIR